MEKFEVDGNGLVSLVNDDGSKVAILIGAEYRIEDPGRPGFFVHGVVRKVDVGSKVIELAHSQTGAVVRVNYGTHPETIKPKEEEVPNAPTDNR